MSKKTKPEQKDAAEVLSNLLSVTEGLPNCPLPETNVKSSSYQENSSSDPAESLMACQGSEPLEGGWFKMFMFLNKMPNTYR